MKDGEIMQLLKHRPLALVCSVFVALSVLSFFLNSAAKVVLGFIIAMLAIVLLIRTVVKRGAPSEAILISVCALGAMLGILISFIHFDAKFEACEKYYGKTVSVKATITERLSSGSYYSSYGIDVSEIDGERVSINAVLECNYSGDFQAGYEITGNLVGAALSEHYDSYSETTMLADGYVMIFEDPTEDGGESGSSDMLEDTSPAITVTNFGNTSLSIKAKRINTRLSLLLLERVGNEEGRLSSALLLGNKNLLSDSLKRDFKRSGVSHILALSGMHMTIILGLAELLLRKLRVPKKVRCVVLLILAPLYLLLTGFALSALRSVIMLSVVYFSYLFADRSDSLTNLFFAGALIILISPHSVCDIGFLLSFCATLGIIVGGDYLKKVNADMSERAAKKAALRPLVKLFVAIATTISANVAIMLILWAYFGELSLVGPVATLVMSPLTYAAIGLSILCLITYPIAPISNAIGFAVSFISRIMQQIAARLSMLEHSSVSISYSFVGVVVVLMCTACIVMSLIRMRHKIFFVVPIVLSFIAIAVGVVLSVNIDGLRVELYHKTKSETLVLVTDSESLVCDISDGSYSHLMRGSEALLESGKSVTDVLMLTHYHKNHIMSAFRYMENNIVYKILMPYPADEREFYIMQSIYERAQRCGVEAATFRTDAPLMAIEGVNLTLTKEYVKRSTHTTLAICIETKAQTACYIGASFHETNYRTVWGNKTAESSVIAFGSHGPKLKTRYSYPTEQGVLKQIWFANEDVATYADVSNQAFREAISESCSTFGGDYMRFHLELDQ